MKTLYVVEALRWGEREGHSYVVGVYSTMKQANVAKIAEECWRGGKYMCEITPHAPDKIDDGKLEMLQETE